MLCTEEVSALMFRFIFLKHPAPCLQVKRDYVEGLGDSLDLVPIGAWYGNGRKAGWLVSCFPVHFVTTPPQKKCDSICFYRHSPFLMACYNPESEEFQSVCRVMSGFSDDFYKEVCLKCFFFSFSRVTHVSSSPASSRTSCVSSCNMLECKFCCFGKLKL